MLLILSFQSVLSRLIHVGSDLGCFFDPQLAYFKFHAAISRKVFRRIWIPLTLAAFSLRVVALTIHRRKDDNHRTKPPPLTNDFQRGYRDTVFKEALKLLLSVGNIAHRRSLHRSYPRSRTSQAVFGPFSSQNSLLRLFTHNRYYDDLWRAVATFCPN